MHKNMPAIVDMHCHVLPGLDDGAKTFKQSLNMLRLAAEDGITTVVATPHLVFDGSERLFAARAKSALASLRFLAGSAGLPVKILLGYEVLLSSSLLHAAGLADYAIEGTGRLLVEALSPQPAEQLEELLYVLEHNSTGLILAHPERNEWLSRHPDYLASLAQRGVLIQVNAGSITGEFGGNVFRSAKRMAARGLIHLIGTDAHSDTGRKPEASAAIRMLADWVGEEEAGRIASGRTEKILQTAVWPQRDAFSRQKDRLPAMGPMKYWNRGRPYGC